MSQTLREKLKLNQVINASGKMTILGGSKLQKHVLDAMNDGAGNFYVIADLMDAANTYLSDLYGLPNAWIVSSASSGIAQSVGAAIAKDNYNAIMNPYLSTLTKREIVIAKGHIVDYGTSIEVPIRMGGGAIVEVGYANACTLEQFAAGINENTAALLYVKSHHAVQKGMPSVSQIVALGNERKIPVIVDAAAEGDLKHYIDLGADAVIYSGTKTFEGPTSGVVVVKDTFLPYLKLQGKGIGRVMKVGKEGVFGLLGALEAYAHAKPESIASQIERMTPFIDAVNKIEGIHAKPIQDGAGRPIMRIEIAFDLPLDAVSIREHLKSGNPQIYTRDYRANEGFLEIDIRDVTGDDLNTIEQRLRTITKGE
ncbi:DgaE family pyridoxal phosphate-dependent ammonia lyase [Erysipelothrix sp. HDW6C]|uniref:DgaE family pyridoxal phosphate-dependent ammonia lyase n=1 Tax=Erysipelothrix sp. HDW6C TaxID=2714930 RepID=UPI001408A0D0|nr:DgaE family pyridoxal phosphate-dependent ammonia lyase [Erysipelothrix sp. HDW6C]QIK69887.1 DgaE family pyridoxal phosphate-dependent ammonia lyase [Erysipelothrix sp. HDW6C]